LTEISFQASTARREKLAGEQMPEKQNTYVTYGYGYVTYTPYVGILVALLYCTKNQQYDEQ